VRALDLAVGANDIVVLDEQKPRLIRLRCNAGGWHASRLEEHLLPAQVDLRWMQIEGDRLLVAPDLHLPLARFGQVTALTTPSRQPALATRKLDRHTGLVWLADGNRRLTRLRLRTAERLGSIVALGRDGEGAAFVVVETLRFPVAVSRVEPPAGPTSSRREVAGGLQVRRRLLKLSPAGRLLAIFDAPASRFAMPERDLALDPASSAVVQLRPDTDAATLLRWSRP
jgi:hypothetical protein